MDEQGLPIGYGLRPQYEITPREAKRLLDDPGTDPLLIDCRTPEEHGLARIAGAMLIPLSEVERRMDEVAEALEEDPDRPVIVYCHHGQRSLRATLFLQAKGIPQARSLAGGIDLWSQDVDRSVPRY